MLSVAISIFAVASSKTRILLSFKMARARHKSCFYPVEKTEFASEHWVSNFFTKPSTNSASLTS